MWGSAGCVGGAGGACALLLALAALLVLRALRRRRCKQPLHSHPHQVQLVVACGSAVRISLAPPPVSACPARCAAPPLTGAPPPPPPHDHNSAPQIVIIPNTTTQTTDPPESTASDSSEPLTTLTSIDFKGIPKLPLPEHWLPNRPFDCRYASTIPRPLTQIAASELGAELDCETRAKKFSATRSPSLEKDDKSPFLSGARIDKSEVFGFDPDLVRWAGENKDMSDREIVPSIEKEEIQEAPISPGNLRRFRSVSTKLNIGSDSPLFEGQHEKSETQNSPRLLECSSAKERTSTSKFNFSPKVLTDTLCSPRFYTPPQTISPTFFTEPSPKSVYYDTVRSPKFFPETPRDNEYIRPKTAFYDCVKTPKFFPDTPKEADIPQSPRTLGDCVNRNGGEKPSSPRVLSARPSPKLLSCNKENYFTFDHVAVSEESATKMSPRPKRYGGRNSIEKERFTPPADKDIKKYRRHNSCDTNYKNIELNISKYEQNKTIENKVEELIDKDVVDSCASKIAAMEVTHKQKIESNGEKTSELKPENNTISIQMRRDRQRLKSISLDSDNAKIIEQNLGLPIAKQMKDQMNEAYKNQDISTSCESIERYPKTPTNERTVIHYNEINNINTEGMGPKSPLLDISHKGCLRQSSDTQSFIDMPRFSPKEFEITITSVDDGMNLSDSQCKRKDKNLRNLTIDLTKRDSDLEKELLEFEKLYTNAEEKKVKTPTLKFKAASLDSSETGNLSLPQNKTLDVPQNSISVPNTPKRQLKCVRMPGLQKNLKQDFMTSKGYPATAEQRRLYMKGQDSGIFLKENHANLMLYQPGTSRIASRSMRCFEEHMSENTPAINVSGAECYQFDSSQTLGSNLLNYKQTLSVSSTNLKTLPEGVPSDDFEPSAEDEKFVKKLHRRNSNQSLMLSTHSLQSSNCSLNSSGASSHNLTSVRPGLSNYSLSSHKVLSLDRRDSNTSLINDFTPTTRIICSSNMNLPGEASKNCLLQRRGSNNSLTLNIQSNNLCKHLSNSSLNKESAPVQKKGLLERRSSNTSLTLNINNSNPQLSIVNKGLSISNYNLNGSTCNLSRYNSNQSIENTEPRKGILERRNSNTSLTLNIHHQEPRDIEIDENALERNLKEIRDTHRKSLSTENLIPKSYRNRNRNTGNKHMSFGSHDNLWSDSFSESDFKQNLLYVCGDQDNELIYACPRLEDQNLQHSFVRNITTKPLSPQSTSEDFRMYLANMQHLQNASSVLTRQQLRDLNDVFQNGYSKVKCNGSMEGPHTCSGRVNDADIAKENPQMVIPEPVISQPCSEYQKMLLRNLHQEFWDMPANYQEKPIVSGSHTKNRYKTILPNEHSRFILKSHDEVACETYINANFIKGHEYTKNCYIATQGPLQNTIYDFWTMVHQNNLSPDPSPVPVPIANRVQKIVMLTNFIENNRQKCEKYFPLELNEEETFYSPDQSECATNCFVIKNTGMMKKPGYTIRKLEVKRQTKVSCDSAVVHHYWFHNWADHKCPKDVNALLNLSLDVLKDANFEFCDADAKQQSVHSDSTVDSRFVFPPDTSKETVCEDYINFTPLDNLIERYPPTIVHCSAGIGRTGCLIAILNGISQLLNEQKVDVLGIVCNMRLNRGGMVQNSEQYELIHKVLCLFEQTCMPVL